MHLIKWIRPMNQNLHLFTFFFTKHHIFSFLSEQRKWQWQLYNLEFFFVTEPTSSCPMVQSSVRSTLAEAYSFQSVSLSIESRRYNVVSSINVGFLFSAANIYKGGGGGRGDNICQPEFKTGNNNAFFLPSRWDEVLETAMLQNFKNHMC